MSVSFCVVCIILPHQYFHSAPIEPRICSYNTRSSSRNTYIQPYAHSNSYFHSFYPSTLSLWNSLPQSVVSAPSLPSFKRNLKDYLNTWFPCKLLFLLRLHTYRGYALILVYFTTLYILAFVYANIFHRKNLWKYILSYSMVIHVFLFNGTWYSRKGAYHLVERKIQL